MIGGLFHTSAICEPCLSGSSWKKKHKKLVRFSKLINHMVNSLKIFTQDIGVESLLKSEVLILNPKKLVLIFIFKKSHEQILQERFYINVHQFIISPCAVK